MGDDLARAARRLLTAEAAAVVAVVALVAAAFTTDLVTLGAAAPVAGVVLTAAGLSEAERRRIARAAYALGDVVHPDREPGEGEGAGDDDGGDR